MVHLVVLGEQHHISYAGAGLSQNKTKNCVLILEENQDTFGHDKGQKSAVLGRGLHWNLRILSMTRDRNLQGPLNGGVSNGGLPDLDLSFLFCPFLGLSQFSWDFPDLLWDGPGIFPISPFPSFSAY